MKNIIFMAVIFYISSSLAEEKYELKNKSDIKKYIGKCSNSRFAMVLPDQDFILYTGDGVESKNREAYKAKNYPYFKLYESKDLNGNPIGELSAEGLILNGVKKCNWNNVKQLEKTYEFFRPSCNLSKVDKEKNEIIKNSCCEEFGAEGPMFPIASFSDKFIELNNEGKSFYLNRSEHPEYVYRESTNKKTLKIKKEFFNNWNPDYKIIQKRITEYFDLQKSCIKNSNSKDCGKTDVPRKFINYLCYENLVKCPRESAKWVKTEEIANKYRNVLSTCFDKEELYIDLSSSSQSKMELYKALSQYKGDLGCQIDITKVQNGSFEIRHKFIVDVKFPTQDDEEMSPLASFKNDSEYKYLKKTTIKNLFCDRIFDPYSVIKTNIFDKEATNFE